MKNPYESDNPLMNIRWHRGYAAVLRQQAELQSVTPDTKAKLLAAAMTHDAEAERLEDLADIEDADQVMAEDDGTRIPIKGVAFDPARSPGHTDLMVTPESLEDTDAH